MEAPIKKIRILVMNGQRLVQEQARMDWNTLKVSKAGRLKPGIYHVSTARDADPALQHTGVVFHADESYLYQKVDAQGTVRHPLSAFNAVPEQGRTVRITYKNERARVANVTLSQSRTLSR